MGTTVRQMGKIVQKIAKLAVLDPIESILAAVCVVGISQTGSCHVSEIVRAQNGDKPLREETRPVYDGLARKYSKLDRLRGAWLRFVAKVAGQMAFIAVDFSDISKLHGKAFEHMAKSVRDASDIRKWIGPGYNTIQIEATGHQHLNLPLWQQIFSTKCPEYNGWYDIVASAIGTVLKHIGKNAIWLFDRGFDAGDFYAHLDELGVRRWVVRQLQTRNVILASGVTMLMSDLAASLHKPFDTEVTYVDKKTHKLRLWPVSFNFVPIRLPDIPGRFWMIVITGLRKDMVLLVNFELKTAKLAEQIVHAYLRRWAVEEGIRCWKQVTKIENFRVRDWNSIKRMNFFAMMAYGIQAYWLLTRPVMAKRLIDRVKQFIEEIPFRHYRLWAGVKDALIKGA